MEGEGWWDSNKSEIKIRCRNLDRAEILNMTEVVKTPEGTFENCLKTFETSALDRRARETKFYAPGIGLIKDGTLELTQHGTVP